MALLQRQALPDLTVTCFDNLKRRGSELNLPRLKTVGVGFRHGDIRCPEDFAGLSDFDLLIDCSAEPSVQAGLAGSPRYLLETNLAGTINCLEAAREHRAAFLFISTSRIFPITRLNALPYTETATRYRWQAQGPIAGFSEHGIAEDFPLGGARSFYGASKLACEQLIEEYVFSYGMQAMIDRCGVLAGPWQMGKVDQGVVALWVARHYFQQPLRYTGFGGEGKQVRDLLHVQDLFDLLLLQMARLDRWDGRIYNVGGGNDGSVSLRELANDPALQLVGRNPPGGFGRAIRSGLDAVKGDVVVIYKADSSDNPGDVVAYYRKIQEGYDCVFGSRFIHGSVVQNYPRAKLIVNRLVNRCIQFMFWTHFNDLTNAFKAYRTEVIRDCGPYRASHFNLTLEMSLGALIRKYHIAEIPIHCYGRTWGSSNLKLREMGRRYLSTLLMMFFQRYLIADDLLAERLAAKLAEFGAGQVKDAS